MHGGIAKLYCLDPLYCLLCATTTQSLPVKELCSHLVLMLCQPVKYVALQMAFRANTVSMCRAFQLTREAYEVALQRDCSRPCERIDACNGSGIDAEHDAMLETYNLCDVCGMTAGKVDNCQGEMNVCGCCTDNHRSTLACTSCIPWEVWVWLQQDPENHHWLCKCCRSVVASSCLP